MELLGKAARVFSGIPMPRPTGRGNIGTAKLSAEREREARNVLPPKIRETFAGPEGVKATIEREKRQWHL